MLVTVLSFSLLGGRSGDARAGEPTPGETILETQAGTPGAAKEEEADFIGSVWKGLIDEAYLRAGYGVIEWAMDIKRRSDGATGRLVQRDNGAFFFSYGSKPSFFGETNFGYTVMVNYVDFDMKKQEIPGDQFADFGTEIQGYLIYAVPTLYYQWGEHSNKGRFIRLGAGAGIGAATYSGTVRLSTGEVISVKRRSYEPRLALSDFIEARWNHFGISVSYASPRIYGDGYDIQVSDYSANIGFFYFF